MKTRNGSDSSPELKGKKEGKEKNIPLAEFRSVNTMRECARLFVYYLRFGNIGKTSRIQMTRKAL